MVGGSRATKWVIWQDLTKLLLLPIIIVTFAIRIKELLLSLLPGFLLAAAYWTMIVAVLLKFLEVVKLVVLTKSAYLVVVFTTFVVIQMVRLVNLWCRRFHLLRLLVLDIRLFVKIVLATRIGASQTTLQMSSACTSF